MRLFIKVILLLFAVMAISCSQIIDESDFDLDYEGDKLVVYGFITQGGGELSLSRTIEPGTPYFYSDFEVGGNADVVLSARESLAEYAFNYNPYTKKYFLSDSIDREQSYVLSVQLMGYPDVVTEPIFFADSLKSSQVDFLSTPEEGVREFPFRVKSEFSGSAYHIIRPVIEEVDSTIERASSGISTDYEALFLDQCGIIDVFSSFAYSTDCFAGDSTILEGVYGYSNLVGPNSFDITVSLPVKIGIQYGTISKNDYDFLLSLRRNQDFLEDYLSREPITISNVNGGYGYILALNTKEFWLEL